MRGCVCCLLLATGRVIPHLLGPRRALPPWPRDPEDLWYFPTWARHTDLADEAAGLGQLPIFSWQPPWKQMSNQMHSCQERNGWGPSHIQKGGNG